MTPFSRPQAAAQSASASHSTTVNVDPRASCPHATGRYIHRGYLHRQRRCLTGTKHSSRAIRKLPVSCTLRAYVDYLILIAAHDCTITIYAADRSEASTIPPRLLNAQRYGLTAHCKCFAKSFLCIEDSLSIRSSGLSVIRARGFATCAAAIHHCSGSDRPAT